MFHLLRYLSKARDALESFYGPKQGYIVTTLAFFAGIALIAIIDKLIPDYENPHEIGNIVNETPGSDNVDPQVNADGYFFSPGHRYP